MHRWIWSVIDAPPNPDCPGCQTLLRRLEHVEQQERRIEKLEARIAQLEELLRRNSSNSSRPPSSDSPNQRAGRPPRPPSGRKPGGQPGHEAHMRAPLPASQITRRESSDPKRCRRCAASLASARALDPLRHQVVEIPKIVPDVTEYVLGRRRCSHCDEVTTAPLPEGVPHGMCGPRLSAMIVLLTGVYRLSRRNAVAFLQDVLGVKLSLGSVSNVECKMTEILSGPHEEALARVQRAQVKHLDATSWAQNGEARSLWTFASRQATAFVITTRATRDAVESVVGKVRGTLVSDRGSQFGFWAMERRQICWAHLIRRFTAFAESPKPRVRSLGNALLLLSRLHLREWHRVQKGKARREELQNLVANLELLFLHHLERGVALRLPAVSGACANVIAHREALFTYAFEKGVPPTNNHAERELRTFVLWRKQTAGTRCERGNRFAERIMTVVHTLRKQGRHVLSYLDQACIAALRGQQTPAIMLADP
jgi:transposase